MPISDTTTLITPPFTLGLLPQSELLLCRFYPQNWQESSEQDWGVPLPAHMSPRAVSKRKTEYVAGRYLAQRLLGKYGCNHKVGRNEKTREPIWPVGFIGSITHSNGLAACALHSRQQRQGVGIDIEHWVTAKTSTSISKEVWLESEKHVFPPTEWTNEQALTAVFSAKESIYKALYPQVQKFFGFKAVRLIGIEGNTQAGQLQFTLTQALTFNLPAGMTVTVNYLREKDWILTGLEV